MSVETDPLPGAASVKSVQSVKSSGRGMKFTVDEIGGQDTSSLHSVLTY